MTRHTARRIAGFYVFLFVFTAFPAAQGTITPETTRLIEKLQVGKTSTIADIGAGSGQITSELARALGADARIYATDIDEKTLDGLRGLVAREDLQNVTVQAGAANETNLPEACCDALLVRNVYHHFGNTEAMNASLFRTLKPGGRFAVVDFPPRNGRNERRPAGERAGSSHGVTHDAVVEELRAAGFRIVEVDPKWTGGSFLVLAERPASPDGMPERP